MLFWVKLYYGIIVDCIVIGYIFLFGLQITPWDSQHASSKTLKISQCVVHQTSQNLAIIPYIPLVHKWRYQGYSNGTWSLSAPLKNTQLKFMGYY